MRHEFRAELNTVGAGTGGEDCGRDGGAADFEKDLLFMFSGRSHTFHALRSQGRHATVTIPTLQFEVFHGRKPSMTAV